MTDDVTRAAVEVAERFAEGEATDEERTNARDAVKRMACSTRGARARLGYAAAYLVLDKS